MLKGKDVMDSYVFKDEDVQGDFPNQNIIVGWVLRTVAIPNINPHQIMKTTQALVKQALKNKEEKKVKAPISETKEIELEKVPDRELKRPQVQGWVKKEEIKPQQEVEEEHQQAVKATVKSRIAETDGEVHTIKTTRQLPTIPKVGSIERPSASSEGSFCPFCGKDLGFVYCPYCGKKLPH
jgi:hypothetical protein